VVVAGGICWVLTIVYLVAQPIVAAAWAHPPYDFGENSISDLGNTSCGQFITPRGHARDVCSPRHVLMNAAFVAGGVLTAAGAVLTWRWWPRRAVSMAGLGCIAMAGTGGVLVGFAPENVNLPVHAAGALLQVPGAAGMVLVGIGSRGVIGRARWFSIVWGAVAVVACLLYLGGANFLLGSGGMERAAFDTLTAWTVVLGGLVLHHPGADPASQPTQYRVTEAGTSWPPSNSS
jgi:hypothetical membrane protein